MFEALHVLMKLFTVFLLAFTFSLANAEGSQSDLEQKQRDTVIEEMAEIIFHNFQGSTKEELIEILKSHPKATSNPNIVSSDSDYVYWGTTVKFKFNNGKLTNVYW